MCGFGPAELLDSRGAIVPRGAVGEIYISGAGVAEGYFNRSKLTEERFIERTFSTGGHPIRMYRTGDVGRVLSDGNLEYLGRNDRQVKVRGFRIEPGEVEARLKMQDGVVNAVVTVTDRDGGHPKLVAYWVPGDAAPSDPQLLQSLRAVLPIYMVPSAFVRLAALPMGPTGKIDESSLPPPSRENETNIYVAPRTETERAISRIWEKVLDTQHPSVHQQFFEAGGHSLRAMLLLAHIRAELGADLPAISIFESPTIAQLSERVETMRRCF